MGELSASEFSDRIQAASPEPLSPACVEALRGHYRLLLRWNERISLVGPGTLEGAIEVHYGESLAALPLLPSTAEATLVDVGTGAGFPGFVLAVARPNLRVTLIESRERKWSFLKAAAAETGISVDCVLGTVDRSLPPGLPKRLDFVTLRALKLPGRAWQALASHLSDPGRVLVWAGREDPEVPPQVRTLRQVALPGSQWKRILELERA
jgi:16S rRNA (guanine527-N7)-methyltransferase